MFTGIVQRVGRVVEVRRPAAGGSDGAARIVIDAGGWRHEAAAGDSICISGCCLTVAEEPAGPEAPLAFDVVPETLRLTTLGRLVLGSGAAQGARVNLERSVTPSTLLGGHLVQGHVEGVGRVASIQKDGGDWRVRIAVPEGPGGGTGGGGGEEMIECITPKGSITVEGVSLTVASVEPNGRRGAFEVALIPTTLEQTTLGDLEEGDGVNLETDILARTVVHWLRTYR
jgi:riboflavin synthase alpha subunit